MKKHILLLVALLFFGLTGCASTQSVGQIDRIEPAATVVSEPVILPLNKHGKVVFMGSGCKPGEEVKLLFKTIDEVTTDIGAYLDPKSIIANDSGAWLVVWSYGHFVKKKLIKKGVYAILVADMDYNVRASAPIKFQ